MKMPTTRKKIIKTIYKDENSDEEEGGDFSDSGSEAIISEVSSSEDDIDSESSSDEEEFDDGDQSYNKLLRKYPPKKSTKPFVRKVAKRKSGMKNDVYSTIFSIRNLSKADKSLPNILNLSESDSSEEESPIILNSGSIASLQVPDQDHENNDEVNTKYKNVWSNIKQVQDDSEEIAKKTFMELEQHKSIIEKTKATLQNYSLNVTEHESDVRDLLALGEESIETLEISMVSKKSKARKRKFDSESESEDWEEVQETNSVPQQGIQLLVEFPDADRRKSKTVDIEMMMKRKINRVKKEYQVHMHKVHVLCWLGHGNYISGVLNDRALLAATLSLIPSKELRPQKKVGIGYIEEILKIYKNCVTLKLDRNEDKLKPKSPPLKALLLDLIKMKVVTSKKYLVFIFVALLRALGLRCRVMFNFVTLPIKPPVTELCSLSTKDKKSSSPQGDKLKIEEKKSAGTEKTTSPEKICNKSDAKVHTRRANLKEKNIPQIDGNYDTSCDEAIFNYNSDYLIYNDYETIMQVDGADDNPTTRMTRSAKRPVTNVLESVSKKSRRATTHIDLNSHAKRDENKITDVNKKPKRGKIIVAGKEANDENDHVHSDNIHFRELTNINTGDLMEENTIPKLPRKSPRRTVQKTHPQINNDILVNKETKKKQPIFSASDDIAVNDHILKPPLKNVSSKTVEENMSSLKTSRKIQKRHIPKPLTENDDNEVVDVNKSNGALKNNSKTRSSKLRAHTMITSEILEVDVSAPKVLRKSLRRSILKENDKDAEVDDSYAMNRTQKGWGIIDPKNKSPTCTEIPRRLTRKQSQIVSKKETVKEKRKPKIDPKIPVNEVKEELSQDKQEVSLNDLTRNNKSRKIEAVENSIESIKVSKTEPVPKKTAKGKIKEESEEDVDYSPIEDKHHQSDSDDSFKPKKLSPKTKANRRSNHRGLSLNSEAAPIKKYKIDIWCEVFDEELRQWISVDVIEGKVISTEEVYANATHPVCYVVGWDNNNSLKDLTRKYVPHYNTETRKLRVDPTWWGKAVLPYLGPKTKRDKEEDEYLNKIQLEAPLPTVIGEYKNHPLYVLKRHLLKFEALYPPDATVLGFVRGEPVYARECVYTCRSRRIWYKEHAKVVKLGENPYKLVKAPPRWDKINRKIITDDPPLEIFGSWQVEDFVPPMAENGIVPRNEYGNVELFKECMLPRGTVHLKLPGLNKIAKKLNIDCATAITGFEVLQGWVRPVYDGFVVCKEFEDIITEAWADDQEEQDRKVQEKSELRIYSNWKRIIKGMLIRERLKNKYGFDEPTTPVAVKDKSKGSKPVAKRKRK